MSARLDTDRMGNTAGTGFYKDKDGDLKRGTNVPDAMWMRRKKFTFVGCAVMGPGGDEVPAIRALIAQNKALGDEETVAWLQEKLSATERNVAEASKVSQAAPELTQTEQDRTLAALAKNIVAETVDQIETRAERRRQQTSKTAPQTASP